MLSIVKKFIGKFDVLILIMAIVIFATLDYSNLDTGDIVYMAVFGIWILLFIARIYILYKNEDGK